MGQAFSGDALQLVKNELKRMLEGDLTTPVSVDAFGSSCQEVGTLLEKTRKILLRFEEELEATSAQVSSVAEEIDAASAQTERLWASYTDLEKATSFLNNTVNELTQIIQKSHQELERLSSFTQSLESIAREVEAMAQTTRTHLEAVDHTLGEVDRVLHHISDIADRTRLVAINASIEAARAGTQGQAFAAVARAVKDLAEQSSQVTKEASQVMESFKSEVFQALSELASRQKDSSTTVQSIFVEVKRGFHSQSENMNQVRNRTKAMQEEFERYFNSLQTHLEQWEETAPKLRNAMTLLSRVSEAIKASLETISIRKEKLFSPAEKKEFQDLVAELQELTLSKEIQSLSTEAHQKALQSFIDQHPLLEAIYTARDDGTFIASIPPAGLANARVRPWWQEAMKGEIYFSPIYVSAITRQFCITISLPIPTSSGKPQGVLGVDIKVNQETESF